MKNDQESPVIFILGPTAVGKTATAIELARLTNGEIISIDSRQIYRGLDIGTAKPTLFQQQEIPHHLIDILDLNTPISAGAYRQKALAIVKEIQDRQHQPIFVGGSGLYVNAVVRGIFDSQTIDPAIRQAVRAKLRQLGVTALYNRLLEIDPDTAIKIHINDAKRITRALEIYLATGEPPSLHYARQERGAPFPYRIFILTAERQQLYARINQRVDEMLAAGLVTEVVNLIKAGYRERLEQLQTLGYQEVLAYLDGGCSFEEMCARIQQNTRRYAKRQLTWFRNQYPEAIWIDVTDLTTIAAIVAKIREYLVPNDTNLR